VGTADEFVHASIVC